MHWSEEIAHSARSRVLPGESVVINSGVSLSAPVHIGHCREFLTAALIAQAVRNQGSEAKLLAYADDLDPLRKRYDFLPESYGEWVGSPLSRIPDPWDCHPNYAEHNLHKLLVSLSELGIQVEVVKASKLYGEGQCAPLVRSVLNQASKVNGILDRITGRKPSEDHWPFKAECPVCHTITLHQYESGMKNPYCGYIAKNVTPSTVLI